MTTTPPGCDHLQHEHVPCHQASVYKNLRRRHGAPVLKQLNAQPTQRTYRNPLPVVAADPYILKAPDGNYYMYDTGAGSDSDPTMSFPAHQSKNLIDWTPIGLTHKRDPATSWGTGDFWAPEVYHRDGKYIMVYSAQWRHNPTHEDENFHIGIAVSDSPRGPFLDVKNEPLSTPVSR